MDFLDEPYVPDEWASPTHPARVIAEGASSLWMSAPMAFGNYRLIGMPKACRDERQDYSPVFGWCFRGELALLASVAVWDPLTEDEPLGWHKRAGEPRRAPQRHLNAQYNRLRCIHGSYLGGTCSVEPYCPEMPREQEKSGAAEEVLIVRAGSGPARAPARNVPPPVAPHTSDDHQTEERIVAVVERNQDMSADDRIDETLEFLLRTSACYDEPWHMEWVLDQMVRRLTGCPEVTKAAVDVNKKPYTYTGLGESLEYQDFVRRYKDGKDGPDSYEWREGTPP